MVLKLTPDRKKHIIYICLIINLFMADFNVIIEKGEDGLFISEVIGIPGCHTQGRTLDELMERTREAIELCLEEQGDANFEVNFIGLQKIEVPGKNVQITATQCK